MNIERLPYNNGPEIDDDEDEEGQYPRLEFSKKGQRNGLLWPLRVDGSRINHSSGEPTPKFSTSPALGLLGYRL